MSSVIINNYVRDAGKAEHLEQHCVVPDSVSAPDRAGHDYRITGLQDYKITGLQDCRIAGLQDYRIIGLQD